MTTEPDRVREPPRFRPVAVDQVTRFFAAIGCQPKHLGYGIDERRR